MSEERQSQLHEILAQDPKNQMARYALAIEYLNAGMNESAINEFRALIRDHPAYVPGYQMLGQAYMRIGMKHEAREALAKGIEAAAASGNAHAQSEMQGMIDEM